MLINKFARIIHFLFLIITIWIAIIVLGISIKKYTMLFVAVAAVICIAGKFLKKKLPSNNNYRIDSKKNIFYVLLIVAFALMLVIAFSLRVDVYNTWDYGQLIRTAYENVTEGKFSNAEYYARYPNNSFYILILSAYFKLISPIAGDDIYNYINATIPVNCLLVSLSILFCYYAAQELISERAAFKCGLIMLGMSPLYLYSTIAYTDVFAIFPVSLILFCYAKVKTAQGIHKKMVWLCLTAVISAAGYKIKATLVIFFIAVIIDLTFNVLAKREKLPALFIYVGLFCICLIAFSGVSKNFLFHNGVNEKMVQQEEFPVTHWIMMSLNPQYEGGFNQEDVDYTKSYIEKQEKVSANINKIKERVKEMGVSGTAEHVFIKKVGRMWGAGDCSASDYVSRQPLSDNILREIFALNGQYNYFYRMCAQLYYVFIIVGILKTAAVLAATYSEIHRDFMIELCFIGVFMFFLIWECNSRYLFVFLPVLGLLTSITEKRRK